MDEQTLLDRIRYLEELVRKLTQENQELERKVINVWGE